MGKRLLIPVIMTVAIVLMLGPVMGLAAAIAAPDENPAVTPAHDKNCICAYETTKQTPQYSEYRGRAGQLERRGGRLEPVEKKVLVCRLYSGDTAKVVKSCPI
jgi:hypothetical protein